MKIRITGTAAAEGIPSPFCECDTCEHARIHKGKNIRRRTAFIINDDLIVDIGPDLFTACAEDGISLANLKYALITHTHLDHLALSNLNLRKKMFRKNDIPELTLVGGPSVMQKLNQLDPTDDEVQLTRKVMYPFEEINLPPYHVKSVKAVHQPLVGGAVNYIIDDGITRVLILSDSGRYEEETWESFRDLRIDVFISEMTMGFDRKGINHSNVDDIQYAQERLRELNAIHDDTVTYATHFSHHHLPPHDELEKKLAELNIKCAYDNLVIEV